MKGIYLASKKHRIPGYNIDYNDIVKYENVDLIIKLFLETIHQ